MKIKSIVAAFMGFAVIAVSGCAVTNGTSIVVGAKRTPTNPEDVRLYTTPPAKYEDVAIVSGEAVHAFMSKQDLMNIAISKIKAEAAKAGANGIILDNVGNADTATTGFAIVQPMKKGSLIIGGGGGSAGMQASGKAIYVLEEK